MRDQVELCDRRRWYVAATHPTREYVARRALEKQAFEVWLPECVLRRTLRRTVITHKAPLFPGYLFVHMDLAVCQWRRIEETVCVERVLCNPDSSGEENPIAVKDEEVAELMRLAAADGGAILI